MKRQGSRPEQASVQSAGRSTPGDATGVQEVPNDARAEKSVLGSILLDNNTLLVVQRLLQPSDFYRESHQKIYGAMLRLRERGSPLDPTTIMSELKDAQDQECLPNGIAYLAELLDGIPRLANFEHYAHLVREKARRRSLIEKAMALIATASNGAENQEIDASIGELVHLAASAQAVSPVDLYGADVQPMLPEFTVSNLIRRSGLHMVWAAPSAGKTWTLLRWMHELLLRKEGQDFCGHPDLKINRTYQRILWIGTEETTGVLRHRGEMVLRGLDAEFPEGRFLHLWASNFNHRITLEDLPGILQAEGPFDAVVLDSLTGLRPKSVDGEKIRWDADNDAANELCLELRGLAFKHDIAIFLVHHTGRNTSKGYRGATDWWASADVMIGLVSDKGRIQVVSEKNRDGAIAEPFYLIPEWEEDTFTLGYGDKTKTKGNAERFTDVTKRLDDFLRAKGPASGAQIARGTEIHRNTASKYAKALIEDGLWVATGKSENNSPIYEHTGKPYPGRQS